jgi:hypothetical protein
MQATVAAICTIVTRCGADGLEVAKCKSDDMQLCANVLLALERTAKAGMDPTFSAAIETCRRAFQQLQPP